MKVFDRIGLIQPTNTIDLTSGHQLKKGDIFRATVINVQGDQAILRIHGELRTAISNLPLQPGESALFQVEDAHKDVYLTKLTLSKGDISSKGLGEKGLGNLLQELGLPISTDGKNIVAHLLSKELPLSKSLINFALKSLNNIPENMKESMIKCVIWLYGAKLKNAKSYQNILQILLKSDETLLFLQNLLKDVPQGKPSFLKEQLLNLLTAQREINYSRQESPLLPDLLYYPLPILLNEQHIPAQLFLVMDGKSQTNTHMPLSLLISVQSKTFGLLWFDLRVQDMTFHITAFTEHPDAPTHLMKTWHLLKEGMEEHGLQLNSFVCRKRQINSVFELADLLDHEYSYRSIDIQI